MWEKIQLQQTITYYKEQLMNGCCSYPAQRLQLTEQAVKYVPELPEFWAEYSEALGGTYEFEAAVEAVSKAINRYKILKGHLRKVTDFSETSIATCLQRRKYWQKLYVVAKQLKISACVIVKNEAENIRHWLEDAFVYGDELLIVDTGSTDETKQIIEEFRQDVIAQGRNATDKQIRVLDFAWIDDFSAARNFAIEQAVGDWIVFLDADDSFYYPERVRGMIAMAEEAQVFYDALLITVVDVDADNHDREMHRYPTPKVFRREKKLIYENKIHECLRHQSGKWDLLTIDDWMSIRHTGYSAHIVATKVQRNYTILMQEIAECGEQPRHYRYLADCYAHFQDYEKMLHYALLDLEGDTSVTTEGDSYLIALQAMEKLQYPVSAKLELLEVGEVNMPQLPDFPAKRGLLLYGTGNMRAAEPVLLHALDLFEGNEFGGRFSTGIHSQLEQIYEALGRIALLRQDIQACKDWWGRGLVCNPLSEAILCQWAELVETTVSASEMMQMFLHELAQYITIKKEFLVTLCQYMQRHGFVELYCQLADYLISAYDYYDGIRPWYTKWLSGQLTDSLLEKKMEENLSKMLVAMLHLPPNNDLRSDKLKKIPEVWQGLVRRFDFGEGDCDYQAYQQLLPVIVHFATDEVKNKYLTLQANFLPAQQAEIQYLLKELEPECLSENMLETAIEQLVKDRYNADLLRLVYRSLVCLYDDVEIIQVLNSLYDKQKDGMFISETIVSCHVGKVFLYYRQLSGEQMPCFELSWAAGRPDAALVLVADIYNFLSRIARR